MTENLKLRFLFCLVGGLAGYAFYLLFEFLPLRGQNPHWHVLAYAIAYGFFFVLLAHLGQVTVVRAIAAAVVASVISGILLFWASFRFDDWASGLGILGVIFVAVILLITPFFIVRTKAPNDWLKYEILFDEAWALVVRGFISVLFVFVFWGVYLLSSYLLELVGLDIFKTLAENVWYNLTLSGVVFGLALAVTLELSNVVVVLRGLVLQLLRLLLPVVAIVTVLFLVMLPFKGISNLFQQLSTSGTLMSITLWGVTLIAATIDADDARAAQSKVLVASARILAVLLPVLAMLSVYAIWLRVHEYGWTPTRVWGAIFTAIVVGYTFCIGFYALFGRDAWRAGIRQGCVYLALGMIGIGALSMSPVLNAQRIATNSQMALYQAGRLEPAKMPVWEMEHDWGVAGKAAVEALRDDAAMVSRLALMDESSSTWQFQRDKTPVKSRADLEAELLEVLPVFPEGKVFDPTVLKKDDLNRLIKACDVLIAEKYKGCAAVFGEFDTSSDGEEILIVSFVMGSDGKDRRVKTKVAFERSNLGNMLRSSEWKYDKQGAEVKTRGETLLVGVQSGAFEIVPSQTNDIVIDGTRLKLQKWNVR